MAKKPVKVQITLRIDPDLIEFYKWLSGNDQESVKNKWGYQRCMNEALRAYKEYYHENEHQEDQ